MTLVNDLLRWAVRRPPWARAPTWGLLRGAAALGLALATLLSPAARAADALTPEQAAQDARVLHQALVALHPALTKYRTQAEIDHALAHFTTRARAARDAAQMLLAASELAAAIRCGHTWVNPRNQGAAVQAWLLHGANKLPFTMTLEQRRWLVLASADPAIAAGDEVLAVNGVAAGDIVQRLWPTLRADGASDHKRLRHLGHDRFDHSAMDTTWPLLSPPVGGRWRVDLRTAAGAERQVEVAATTLAARRAALDAQGVPALGSAWTLRIDGDVATLTLPSFAFWNQRFDWSRFLDDSFAEIAQRRVPHLLIDIRDNEGGDTAIGHRILSHLIRAPLTLPAAPPVSAYERVPYALARYLDTWNFDFFDRTGQVDKITDGTAAGLYRVTGRGAAQTLQPRAPQHTGHRALLVGGENSSAAFQFAQLAQQAQAARLVGEPTGGNLRGLNSGQLAWVRLPNSGVAVDIPLLAAPYSADTPDASVTPDTVVEPDFDARRAGRDRVREAALRELRALR